MPVPPPRLAPKRKIGSPSGRGVETQARDLALEKLSSHRGALCEVGREVAVELCRQRTRITSVEVFAEMRARGYDEALDNVDPRWMGVVFRETIWRRIGWETTGSHRRPVAIWGLVDPAHVPPSPRTKVYAAIDAAGSRGMTTEEAELATGLSFELVRRAVKDLVEEDVLLGHGERRRLSGRRALVWVTTRHHPDIL